MDERGESFFLAQEVGEPERKNHFSLEVEERGFEKMASLCSLHIL